MGAATSKHPNDATKVAPDVTSSANNNDDDGNNKFSSSSSSDSGESKCPMHKKDGSGYSYDWTQLFKAAAVHGPTGTKPLSEEEQKKAREAMKGRDNDNGGGGGGCPVKHGTSNNNGPQYPEYNVRGEPIDKTNQMPKGVKTQMPSAFQNSELSTDRVKSSIPKGGGDNSSAASATTWTYPSPQQFYNALVRKGKADDTTEDDIASVVALHNNMNEKTWAKVVEWEHQTYKDGTTPKLLKFMGRPHDLSPKAWLKHKIFGHPMPYDRHDWTVLRDDGTTVRYTIDYYYDESRAQTSEESSMPELHDRDATPSLLVDVRPALDGPSQLYARAVQMPYAIWTGKSNYEPLPMKATAEMASQVQESVQVWQAMQDLAKQEKEQQQQQDSVDNMAVKATKISEDQAKIIALNFAKAIKDCKKATKRVANCTSEEDCSKASVDLTMCMGQHICGVQHKNLVQTLETSDDVKIEAALETLTECVMLKTAERRHAREQHPELFS